MRDKLTTSKAAKIISKYKSYTEFSKNATNSEKKTVFKSTLIKANEMQRKTAGLK